MDSIIDLNVKFYYQCRSLIEPDVNTIYKEIQTLFEFNLPSKWLNLRTSQIENRPERNTGFKDLQLKKTCDKHFYLLCRFQLGVSYAAVLDEIKHIFGCDPSDEKNLELLLINSLDVLKDFKLIQFHTMCRNKLGTPIAEISAEIKQILGATHLDVQYEFEHLKQHCETLELKNNQLEEDVKCLKARLIELNKQDDNTVSTIKSESFEQDENIREKEYDEIICPSCLKINELEKMHFNTFENKEANFPKVPESLTKYFIYLQQKHSDKISVLESEINNLRIEACKKNKEHKDEIERHEFHMAITNNELNNERETNSAQLQKLNEERIILNERLEDLSLISEKEKNKYENYLKENEKKIESFEKDIAQLKKIKADLESQLLKQNKIYEDQLNLYKKQTDAKNVLKKDLDFLTNDMNNKIKKLEVEINSLKGRNDRLSKSKADLEQEVKNQKETIESMYKDFQHHVDKRDLEKKEFDRMYSKWIYTAKTSLASHKESFGKLKSSSDQTEINFKKQRTL